MKRVFDPFEEIKAKPVYSSSPPIKQTSQDSFDDFDIDIAELERMEREAILQSSQRTIVNETEEEFDFDEAAYEEQLQTEQEKRIDEENQYMLGQ